MKNVFLIFTFFTIAVFTGFSQQESTVSRFQYAADFRFRAEQDWDSRKSDGSYRDDRTRFRYRARFGVTYRASDWAAFGLRIRTGYRNKQQDPNITLGDKFNELSTVPLGFDKLYFKMKFGWFDAWFGKNSFPFKKLDELFWSDNVSPEGFFARASFGKTGSGILSHTDLRTGYFIIRSSNNALSNDSFFTVLQANATLLDNRLNLFPSVYLFKNIPDIPDGFETYTIDYSVFQFGMDVKLLKNRDVVLSAEYLYNFRGYANNVNIPDPLRDQVNGITTSIRWGKLAEKGDFTIQLFYTYLERFAAVDFMAQNDWARWDYSAYGSPDGRLTNMKGFQLTAAYQIAKKINMRVRYYNVDQIIPYGAFIETGQRVRLDFNIAF